MEFESQIALGLQTGLMQVEVLHLTGEVQHAADVLQASFGKDCHFLQIDVLVDGTGVSKRGLLFLEAEEAVEAGEDGGLGVADHPELLELHTQQVVDGKYHFLADSYAKYWHCFPQQPHQLLLSSQPPQQLLLLPLAQQFVVCSQGLQLMRAAHFEWKVFVELTVPKALLAIEVALQAFLQEPASGCLQDIYVFLVDGAFEAAVVGVEGVEGGLFGMTAWLDVGGGVLVADLERLIGHLHLLLLLLHRHDNSQLIICLVPPTQPPHTPSSIAQQRLPPSTRSHHHRMTLPLSRRRKVGTG